MTYLTGFFCLGVLLTGMQLDSGAEVKLVIEAQQNAVAVMLVNTSYQDQVVDKRLGVAPLLGELTLLVRDASRLYPFTAMVRVEPPSDSDYVVLKPGEFVGNIIRLDLIAGSYQLKPGCYELQAIYEYKWGLNADAFIGPLKSNIISVCFP